MFNVLFSLYITTYSLYLTHLISKTIDKLYVKDSLTAASTCSRKGRNYGCSICKLSFYNFNVQYKTNVVIKISFL